MGPPVFQFRFRKWVLYVMAVTIALGIVLIAALTISTPGQSLQNTPQPALSVGRPAPDFALETLDGRDVNFSQFRGYPVLINFCAAWRIPCREEMRGLVRSYETHKADGLIILGLNLTNADSLPDIEECVQEFQVTFPVLLDEDGTLAGSNYGIPGIPTSIFIDRIGIIARIQVGRMTAQQIEQFVAEILDSGILTKSHIQRSYG